MSDLAYEIIRSGRFEELMATYGHLLYPDWPTYQDRLDNGDCDAS